MCIGLRATKEEPIDNIKDAKVVTYQYYSPGNFSPFANLLHFLCGTVCTDTMVIFFKPGTHSP